MEIGTYKNLSSDSRAKRNIKRANQEKSMKRRLECASERLAFMDRESIKTTTAIAKTCQRHISAWLQEALKNKEEAKKDILNAIFASEVKRDLRNDEQKKMTELVEDILKRMKKLSQVFNGNENGVRYNEKELRLALAVYCKSKQVYKSLQDSGSQSQDGATVPPTLDGFPGVKIIGAAQFWDW